MLHAWPCSLYTASPFSSPHSRPCDQVVVQAVFCYPSPPHTRTCTHTHACMYARTRSHRYTDTHTHTHTHAPTPAPAHAPLAFAIVHKHTRTRAHTRSCILKDATACRAAVWWCTAESPVPLTILCGWCGNVYHCPLPVPRCGNVLEDTSAQCPPAAWQCTEGCHCPQPSLSKAVHCRVSASKHHTTVMLGSHHLGDFCTLWPLRDLHQWALQAWGMHPYFFFHVTCH